MKQFTHISIQQVHYSGSVENTVAFYDEAARQLAIANAAPQLVEALKAVISEYDRDMANGLTVASDAIASARAALKAAGVSHE